MLKTKDLDNLDNLDMEQSSLFPSDEELYNFIWKRRLQAVIDDFQKS